MKLKQIAKILRILIQFKKSGRRLNMSHAKRDRYKLKRLKKVVKLAYEKIPFYKKKWDNAGFNPSMIKTLEDINKIPILTKDELRSEYFCSMNTTDWKDGRWLATTGSTGAYINLFQPMDKVVKELSIMSPMFISSFFNRKLNKGLLFLVIEEDSYEAMGEYEVPNPKVKFADVFTPLNEMVKMIREFAPKVILTYPSRLKELLEYIEDNNIDDLNIPVVLTSGEKLDGVTRKKSAEVFKASVHEAYAVTEVGAIAIEGPQNDGLQMLDWKVMLQICDDNGVELPNETVGNVIVTDLDNEVMPIIRYSGLGDMASYKDKSKAILNPISGRKIDIVKSPKGRSIHPFKLTLEVQKVNGINKYQIQQNNLENLDVLVVAKKDACHDTIKKEINMYMQYALENELDVNVHMVDEIPRKNNSHKHATVLSTLQ